MTLSPVIFGAALVVAMLLGGAIAWVVATARERETRARAETELQARLSAETARASHESERRSALDQELASVNEARNELDRKISAAEVQIRTGQERIEEQKEFITSSRKEFEDTFKALSAAALEGSTKQFLELAEQRWKTSREEVAGDLEKRRQGIEAMLAPLKETLKNLDVKTAEMEKERRGAYDGLKVHLTHLQNATTTLQDRTTTLASALRGTQVRGRWGELALRNIAELAGMTEHCDFTEQTTTDEGKRPDMVVHLPEGRFIAVDSKVPLSGYLKAIEAADEEGRQSGLKEHVQAVRNHIKTLAARDYAESLEGDVDLVVLFLPGDPFLAAAFGEDPDLQVEAIRSGVLLATPTTLVALLRTVAIYHQHLTLAENAREIGEVAATLYDRAAKFGDDLARAGRGLKTAVDAFNAAVGSFERRILPMGQKLESLKVTEQTKRRLSAPQVLTEGPRTVNAGTGEEMPGKGDD
ncbi:MAG: DNA recombination protein RmuC [Acidobacteriota bacterium]|nr:DNA recombination protein RmuC [Acidobacteriota bacterium]